LDGETRQVDVVILTAIRLEFDAVRRVDAGAVLGSEWEEVPGPSGLPVMFREFLVKNGRPPRVAVALSPDMGPTAATNTLLPLVAALKPRCIAMCGVCAGRRGKTNLGDVVAADRLFYHDTGKRLPDEVQQDLTTYKLRDDWKTALEGMDGVVVAHFGGAEWFKARPITTEWRERRALVSRVGAWLTACSLNTWMRCPTCRRRARSRSFVFTLRRSALARFAMSLRNLAGRLTVLGQHAAALAATDEADALGEQPPEA
jgi:nucleoside phosphorylase